MWLILKMLWSPEAPNIITQHWLKKILSLYKIDFSIVQLYVTYHWAHFNSIVAAGTAEAHLCQNLILSLKSSLYWFDLNGPNSKAVIGSFRYVSAGKTPVQNPDPHCSEAPWAMTPSGFVKGITRGRCSASQVKMCWGIFTLRLLLGEMFYV